MNLQTIGKRLVRDEDGQDLIEYALLATFVSLVAIAGATALGTALDGWYNAVAGRVNTASSAAASRVSKRTSFLQMRDEATRTDPTRSAAISVDPFSVFGRGTCLIGCYPVYRRDPAPNRRGENVLPRKRVGRRTGRATWPRGRHLTGTGTVGS